MGLFDFFAKKQNNTGVVYRGGDGTSEQNAVIIITT
jgi:hypothetical protein